MGEYASDCVRDRAVSGTHGLNIWRRGNIKMSSTMRPFLETGSANLKRVAEACRLGLLAARASAVQSQEDSVVVSLAGACRQEDSTTVFVTPWARIAGR